MKITIEGAEGDIEEIKAAVVAHLIAKFSPELDLLTPSQVCGILDLTPKSLGDMALDKVDLLNNGKTIRYKASSVAEAVKERTIKGVRKPRTR